MARSDLPRNYAIPVPKQSSTNVPANGELIAGGEEIFDGVNLSTPWVSNTDDATGSATGSAALGTYETSSETIDGYGCTRLVTSNVPGNWSRFQLSSPGTNAAYFMGPGNKYRGAVAVYIEDYTKISDITLIFSITTKLLNSGGVPANAIRFKYKIMEDSFGATNRFNGWHVISSPHGQWVSSGTWGTSAKCRYAGVQITPVAGEASVPVLVGPIHTNIKHRPKCIIWADDGWQSWYDNGVTYLDTLGLKCTMATIQELVGTASYMDVTTLASAVANGHEVVPHGLNFLYNYASAQEIYDEIKLNQDFVINNGLGNGRHYVYPGGYHELVTGSGDMVVREQLQSLGFLSARASNIGDAVTSGLNYQHLGMGDRKWFSSVIGAYPTLTPAQLLSRLDLCIADGMLAEFMFHKLLASGASQGDEYNTPDFETFADGVKRRVDAGLVDVVTRSQWYDGLYGKRAEIT